MLFIIIVYSRLHTILNDMSDLFYQMMIHLIILLVFISSFVINVFKIFDLYTVLYQTTTQTMCYTVCMECQQTKTLVHFFHFSRMLHQSDTHFVMCWLFLLLLKSSYFIGKYVISLWTWGQNLLLNVFCIMALQNILKCIVIHSTLTRPLNLSCLLKYLVYPKRSFHLGSSLYWSDKTPTSSSWMCYDVIQMFGKLLCIGYLIWVLFVKPKMLESVHKIMSIMWCLLRRCVDKKLFSIAFLLSLSPSCYRLYQQLWLGCIGS